MMKSMMSYGICQLEQAQQTDKLFKDIVYGSTHAKPLGKLFLPIIHHMMNFLHNFQYNSSVKKNEQPAVTFCMQLEVIHGVTPIQYYCESHNSFDHTHQKPQLTLCISSCITYCSIHLTCNCWNPYIKQHQEQSPLQYGNFICHHTNQRPAHAAN